MTATERVARNEQQDVPAIESGLTSSIGGLWPPEKASFNRIKGIYTPGIIDCSEHLEAVLTELAFQSRLAVNGGSADRVSFRVVFSCDLLRKIAPSITSLVEALVPLSGTQPEFEDAVLVYLGINGRNRQPVKEELERYLKTIRSIPRNANLPESSLERVRAAGYELRMLPLLDRVSPSEKETIIAQMSELYDRFGWSRTEVEEILYKSNSIIAVARKGGQIISAGIAEMATVPLGNNSLRFIEITEAATADGHGGQGLYTAVSTSLLLEIAVRSKAGKILDGQVDLVYGECNGNAPGVLKTSAYQGRTFAVDLGDTYGFPESGFLPQHVPISGAERQTPYNDLFPTFLTRKELYRIYA